MHRPRISRPTLRRPTLRRPTLRRPTPPDLRRWSAILGTLALGAAGGIGFAVLGLPLPWMLGALVACLAAVLAGVPLRSPERIRPPVVAILGVMLGASFEPGLFARAGAWLLSLAGLAAYVAIAAALVVPFYRRVGGMDRTTAFFAAMPGGISEMMLIGESMGGDGRRIILSHAARIVTSIALIAVWFRGVLGLEVGMLPAHPGGLGAEELAVLAACGILGALVGVRLGLPAPTLLGPMILSAAAHMTGLAETAPPAVLVRGAQVVLGTIMGCRFIGATPRMVLGALGLSTVATAIMLTIAVGFAFALHAAVGQPVSAVVLAYAPGGLTEMTLLALSIGSDVAYIALHHVIRIVLLLAVAPLLIRGLLRRRGGG